MSFSSSAGGGGGGGGGGDTTASEHAASTLHNPTTASRIILRTLIGSLSTMFVPNPRLETMTLVDWFLVDGLLCQVLV